MAGQVTLEKEKKLRDTAKAVNAARALSEMTGLDIVLDAGSNNFKSKSHPEMERSRQGMKNAILDTKITELKETYKIEATRGEAKGITMVPAVAKGGTGRAYYPDSLAIKLTKDVLDTVKDYMVGKLQKELATKQPVAAALIQAKREVNKLFSSDRSPA